MLAVDFERFNNQKRTFLSYFHRPHGYVNRSDIINLLSDAELNTIDSGPVGIRDLQFVLAQAPDGRC